jgi:hypothetical protein
MTWDPRQAAVFSAAIRSHRTGTATPAPERISPMPSGESYSVCVIPIVWRERVAARKWLKVGLKTLTRARRKTKMTTLEAMDCDIEIDTLCGLIEKIFSPHSLVQRREAPDE